MDHVEPSKVSRSHVSFPRYAVAHFEAPSIAGDPPRIRVSQFHETKASAEQGLKDLNRFEHWAAYGMRVVDLATVRFAPFCLQADHVASTEAAFARYDAWVAAHPEQSA